MALLTRFVDVTLRGSIRPVARRFSVGLLVVAVLLETAWTSSTFALTAYASSYHSLIAPFVALLGSWLLFVVLAPLLAGLYVPMCHDRSDLRRTVEAAGAGVRKHYRSLFANAAVVLGLAIAAAIFAMSLLIVADTAMAYWAHVSSDPRPPPALGLFRPLVSAATVGFVLALILCQFADVAVVQEGIEPRWAWRESLRFTQRNPLTAVGVTVLSVSLLWIPSTVAAQFPRFGTAAVLAQPGLGTFVVPMLVTVVVGAICLGLLALLRLTVYQQTKAPRAGPSRLPSLPWRGIAVGSIVLLATVGGAVAVRSMDVGVEGDSLESLPEAPDAAYDVAAENTARSSHRAITTFRNEGDSPSNWTRLRLTTVDYDDREHRMALYENGSKFVDSHFSETLLATWEPDTDVPRRGLQPLTHRVGNWSVTVGAGYGVVHERPYRLPIAGLNWSVHHVNDSTISYRVEDRERLTTMFDDLYRHPGGRNLSRDSYAVARVDRERGTVETVRSHYEWSDTGAVHEYVTQYHGIDSKDLERPAALGPRRGLEHVWDVLYY